MKSIFLKNTSLVVLVILCLPLLFINVKDTHDWGDDFAQYFLQARNIIEHRPQTDNGLIFDQQSEEYVLKAYPVGFPLMIASVWQLCGHSIEAFAILISFLMIGLAILIFIYLKKNISSLFSLLLVLTALYNPLILDLKKQVLSDIPFSFFFLLSLLLFRAEKKNLIWSIITGILFGYTLSTRGIGVVLFVALLIWIAKDIWNKLLAKAESKEINHGLLNSLLIFFSGTFTYFFLNSILFPIPSGNFFGFYTQAFHDEHVLEMIRVNIFYYYEVLKYFFNQGEGIWLHISALSKYVMIYGFLFGMIISWKRNFKFDDLAFILYVIVLLIYPYQAGGFRFLIPVVPFILKYFGIGILTILKWIRIPAPELMITFLMLTLLFQNKAGITWIIKSQKSIEDGPQTPEAAATLGFIKNNLPADAVISFVKPRALSFYSDKKAPYITRNLDVPRMHQLFTHTNTYYYLINNNNPELLDRRLKAYIEKNNASLKPIWQKGDFIIYSDRE